VALSCGRSFHEALPLGHTCAACKLSQEIRSQWGCDAPTKEPQLWIPCVRCAGDDLVCALCHGLGYESIHRCPRKLITEETWEYLRLFEVYPQVLPLSGGLLQQAAPYVRAMRLLAFATKRLEADAIQDAHRPPDSIPGRS